MPTRSGSSLILALVSACLVASGGTLAISACSSTVTESSAAAEGGTDAAPDTRKVVEAGEEPDSGATPTQAQCIAKCGADHPGAAAKEDAIDKCWTDNCTAPCVDQSGGFDGGPDAAVDAGGQLCGTAVSSGVDDTCDQCTEAFCCTAWKGCFNDPDCTAYDQCLGDCL